MASFITQNKKKAEQVGKLFQEAGIPFDHIAMDYDEPDGLTIQETAKLGAQTCAEQLGKAVFVDDTGVFFEDYDNYPGAHAKRNFQHIGYAGLLEKIRQGPTKKAYFACVLAYCEPGQEPVLFEGRLVGALIPEIQAPEGYDPDNFFPHDRFFIPEGYVKTLAWLRDDNVPLEDHRIRATKKLLDWLKNSQKV